MHQMEITDYVNRILGQMGEVEVLIHTPAEKPFITRVFQEILGDLSGPSIFFMLKISFLGYFLAQKPKFSNFNGKRAPQNLYQKEGAITRPHLKKNQVFMTFLARSIIFSPRRLKVITNSLKRVLGNWQSSNQFRNISF